MLRRVAPSEACRGAMGFSPWLLYMLLAEAYSDDGLY